MALVVFFLSLLSTHGAIVRAKRAELAVAAKQLEKAFRELRSTSGEEKLPQGEMVYSTATAWAAHERRLKEVSEWPYGAQVVRRLAASVFVPSVVYALKLLLAWRV